MSTLFSVSVLEVSSRSAKLRVKSTHPDSGPPAPNATFALMLIYDPMWQSRFSDFAQYPHVPQCALAQAMDQDDYLNPDWLNNNARAFISRVTKTKDILEIEPTHPAWIEHLRVGMSWDTAAYVGGPGLPAAVRAPVAPSTTHSKDPAAGFRVGPPKDNSYKLPGAFIPLYGAKQYLADPIIDDLAKMKAETKTMLGEPVLIVPKSGPPEIGTLVEHRGDSIFLYYETSSGGWGGSASDFSSLKSLGRAWLKDAPQAAAQSAAPKPAKKVSAASKPKSKKVAAKPSNKKSPAKKVTAKKPAVKRAVSKKATKKPAVKKPAKKAASKKTVSKRPASKKSVSKKTSTAKKPSTKKKATKK